MGQISTKYFFKLYCQKMFAASFESYIQLVLKTSFTSFLQPAWIETDSIVNPFAAVGCVQLVPNISKVKLDRRQPPNILSEIIEIKKNWAWGNHFGKSPYYHFTTEHNALPFVIFWYVSISSTYSSQSVGRPMTLSDFHCVSVCG